MATTKGIDVSVWQGNIDFNEVKAAGIDFVIIRAGYGRLSSQKDRNFETYYAAAKKAGLKIGAYWYSYAQSVSEAKLEANACVSCIKGKRFDLPVYFDVEDGLMTGFSKSTLTGFVTAFCDIIKASGFKAGVYANLNWFSNKLDYDVLKAKYSIWLAQWGSSKNCDCDIWQYSQCGNVNGIINDVDMNYCYANFGKANKPTASAKIDTDGNATIKAVQKRLNEHYKADLAVDGIYGTKTKTALVKALQDSLNHYYGAGLTVDGIYGAKTKAAVRNLNKGHSGDCTRTLQGLLICNGYNIAFDGVFGDETAKAVKDFQKKRGLTVDGVAGKETFAALCQ